MDIQICNAVFKQMRKVTQLIVISGKEGTVIPQAISTTWEILFLKTKCHNFVLHEYVIILRFDINEL